jgi:RNA polymerase sigma-B factor
VPELVQQLGRTPRPGEIAERLGTSTVKVLAALTAARACRLSSLDETSPSATAGGASLLDELGGPDSALALVELHHTLQPLLDGLTDTERRILAPRFFGEMTQSQIAAQIDISQMHVSRLLCQILALPRGQLQET